MAHLAWTGSHLTWKSGHLSWGCPAACSFCQAGTTPSTYTATLLNVNATEACYICPHFGPDGGSYTVTGSWDGSYTLDVESATACRWIGAASGTITVRRTGCENP